MAKKQTRRRRGVSKASRQAAARKAAKPMRKAARKAPARQAKAATKAAKPTARGKAKKPAAKPARAKALAKAAAPKAAAPKAAAPKAAAVKAPAKKAAAKAPARRRPPTLDRARRTVTEPEMVPTPPSSLDLDRSASAARSGRADLSQKLRKLTSTGPALTAGDVDADWEAAESVGDEAPGGDNPTPDQDVVDEIGKSLGVEYDDDEELQGGDEIVERDRNRWELDPASRDDFEDE